MTSPSDVARTSNERCGTFVPRDQLCAGDRRELRNYDRYLRLWPRFKQRMLLRPRWQKYLGITPRQAWKYGKTLLKEEAAP